MSQVKIQGNASGTGIFTLAAPNSNTDRTLTLPDSTGTVALTSDIPTGASTDFGGIGSYIIAGSSTTGNAVYNAGTTFAGSTLEYNGDRGTGFTQSLSATTAPYINSVVTISNYGLSGTWRLMTFMRGQDSTYRPIGLFVRIS
jgi:hypothetical protein